MPTSHPCRQPRGDPTLPIKIVVEEVEEERMEIIIIMEGAGELLLLSFRPKSNLVLIIILRILFLPLLITYILFYFVIYLFKEISYKYLFINE